MQTIDSVSFFLFPFSLVLNSIALISNMCQSHWQHSTLPPKRLCLHKTVWLGIHNEVILFCLRTTKTILQRFIRHDNLLDRLTKIMIMTDRITAADGDTFFECKVVRDGHLLQFSPNSNVDYHHSFVLMEQQ
jgi:hypothetical protein